MPTAQIKDFPSLPGEEPVPYPQNILGECTTALSTQEEVERLHQQKIAPLQKRPSEIER